MVVFNFFLILIWKIKYNICSKNMTIVNHLILQSNIGRILCVITNYDNFNKEGKKHSWAINIFLCMIIVFTLRHLTY
jgi:hypothetical protein